MAFKARFSRREDGGYDACYGKQSKKLAAVLIQSKGEWIVSEGFKSAGEVRPSKKLADVKEGWARHAEAAYDTPAGAIKSAPPRLSGPPSLRRAVDKLTEPVNLRQIPPRVGPPSLRVAQGIQPNRTEVVDRTEEGEAIRELRTFEQEIERMAGIAAISIAEKGVATCPSCGRPFAGWSKDENGNSQPPCRCTMPNDDDYSPDPLDPRMHEMDYDNRLLHITPMGALDQVYHWMLRNPDYVKTDGKLDKVWANVQETLFRNTGYAEYRLARLEAPDAKPKEIAE